MVLSYTFSFMTSMRIPIVYKEFKIHRKEHLFFFSKKAII